MISFVLIIGKPTVDVRSHYLSPCSYFCILLGVCCSDIMEWCEGLIGPQFVQSMTNDAAWRQKIRQENHALYESLQSDLQRPGAFSDPIIREKYRRLRGTYGQHFKL